MSYAEAARSIVAYIGTTDNPSLPLNVLLLARAGEAIAPISAAPDHRSFGIGSRRLVATSDFYALARLPGVQYQQLTAEASATFVVDATDPPDVLLSAFRSTSLGEIIGANNVAVLRAMREAWDVRIRATGFWTSDQVDLAVAIIDGGVLCFPVAARALKNRNPNLPAELLSPAIGGDANQARYDAICAIFADVLAQYNHKNMAEAAAAVDAANARADLWADLQKIAEAVRDAPSTVAMATGRYVGGAVWDTLVGNWPLVLIVAGGAVLYFYRGRALAAVQRVAKSAAKSAGAAA